MNDSDTITAKGQTENPDARGTVFLTSKDNREHPFSEKDTQRAKALAEKLKIPFVDPFKARIETSALTLVTKEKAFQLQALPVRIVNGTLLVAVASPENPMVVKTLETITGIKVRPAAAPKGALLAALKKVHEKGGSPLSQKTPPAPEGQFEKDVDKDRTVTISIISNKGGVGKTHIAINLACALAQAGGKVLLIDADLGNADISNKLAIFPEHHLMDFLEKERRMEDLIVETKFGFDLICGTYGEFKLANVNYAQKMRFIKHFTHVSKGYDYAIFDLGAGIARTILDFALGAEYTLIVTTPQDLISGYACAKAAFYRFIEIEERLEEKMSDYSPRWTFSPFFVINQTASAEEGFKLFAHISRTADDNINSNEGRFSIAPEYLGSMEFNKESVRNSEARKTPLLVHAPYLKLSQSLQHMASRFCDSHQTFDPRIKYKHPLKRFMAVLSQKM